METRQTRQSVNICEKLLTRFTRVHGTVLSTEKQEYRHYISNECLNLHSRSGKCMQQEYNKRAKVSGRCQVQKLRAKNGTIGHCFQVWKLCTARTCQARENRSSVYMLENVQSVPGVGVYLCVESADW